MNVAVSGKVLRQLIQAGALGDADSFRRASEAVIEQERQKQHHLLANDLERILYGSTKKAITSNIRSLLPAVPEDKERGLPLLDVRQAQRSIEEVILSNENLQIIEELLEQHRRADLLRSYGMKPSGKVLFYGSPGCGKTLAAEVIAYELSLPLAIVRLDALVSSYLGETAANLGKVFEYITQNKVVALFDEFDALGKTRNDQGEHGELRRVVNAVLQKMDAYSGESIILAATNHEGMLDPAIWRRFDEIVEFSLPDNEQVKHILSLKLRGVRREFDLEDKSILKLFEGKSGADIERVVRRAVKHMILRNKEFLQLRDLQQALAREMKQKISK